MLRGLARFTDGIELQPAQLAMILSGIDLQSARQRKRLGPLAYRRDPGHLQLSGE